MKYFSLTGLVAAALMAGASAVSAQEAVTTNDVNMRAGPGTRFPVVTTIPEERPVVIHGCLSDYDWCDVSWRSERGWVFSDYLDYLYRNRPVTFYEYRQRVDVPVISFGYGYWDRNYRNRPWFDDWDRWGGSRRWSDRQGTYNRDGGRIVIERGTDSDQLYGNDWSRQNSRNRNTDLTDDNWSNNTHNDRQRGRDRFDDGSDGRNRDRVMRCDDNDMGPDCQTGSVDGPRYRRNRQNRNDDGDADQ